MSFDYPLTSNPTSSPSTANTNSNSQMTAIQSYPPVQSDLQLQPHSHSHSHTHTLSPTNIYNTTHQRHQHAADQSMWSAPAPASASAQLQTSNSQPWSHPNLDPGNNDVPKTKAKGKGKGKTKVIGTVPPPLPSASSYLGQIPTSGPSSAASSPALPHVYAHVNDGSSVSPGEPSRSALNSKPSLTSDSQFPYAGFLQSVPPNPALSTPAYLDSQTSASYTGKATAQPSTHYRADRPHPYNHTTNPTQDDIIRRHTTPRSYWDDPSPEQDLERPSLTSAASGSAKEGKEASLSKRGGQKRRQKYTRTRTGCLCCRARRIKCDEGRPVCKRCVIAKKEYPDAGDDAKSSPRDPKSRQNSEDSADRSEEDVKVRQVRTGRKPGQDAPPAGNSIKSNLTIPPASTETAIDASQVDYGFDASFIGDYGVPTNEAAEVIPEFNANDGDLLTGNWNLAGPVEKPEWAPEQGGAPMLATPNFLLPWFPTTEERSLILHYCANAASLMMAIPSGLNPMLAINLPLALDSPRGVNASADALRVALLGTGAIHQAFLLARSGVATAQTGAMFQYASTLRDTGKEMVRRAVRENGGAITDAALGASTALATIDIFFGGGNWRENFELAKEMVALRGGPAEMLKQSQPTKLTEGVTVSPARLMLEILTIYETFSCLTTGEEPSLVSDRWDNWWLEGSRSTYEEHSVEKQFGMSRVMVLLFARLTRLVSRAARSKVVLTETDPTSPSSGATLVLDPLLVEARRMNADVDAWIESLQLSTLEHERVQVGNRAYAHAMKILLLRMVFRYPRDDARVQNAAMQVLQHCSWSTAALGMSIDLTWPAIIAGSCVDGSSRTWLITLLEGFKAQCCFDIDTASRIIHEVWRRADNHEPRDDWKEVCDDLGLQVLLC